MQPREDRLAWRALIVLGVAAAIGTLLALLWYIVDVLLLAFAGALLAILLRAPADWLSRRTGLPPFWSLMLVLIVLFALLGTGGWLFGQTLSDQVDQLAQRLPEAFREARERLQQYEFGAWLVQQLEPRQLTAGAPGVVGQGLDVIATTFGVIANVLIALFIGIFLAAQPGLYVGGFLRLVPVAARPRAHQVLTAIGEILRRWLVGQVFLMFVVGAFVGVGLSLLGAPFPLALALLAGLLTFIPYIGPVLWLVPAVLVAFSESLTLVLQVLLLYLAVQMFESYLLEPLVQRKAVYLPPALLLFSQVVLGVLIGLLGVALATPLMASVLVAINMLYVQDILGDRREGA